jgi:hypothetical protein
MPLQKCKTQYITKLREWSVYQPEKRFAKMSDSKICCKIARKSIDILKENNINESIYEYINITTACITGEKHTIRFQVYQSQI